VEIYFLRHGDAADKAAGQSDAERPLTEEGMKQARQAAEWFAKHQIEFDAIVSSPLLRAVQTAEPIAEALNMELGSDRRLSGGQLTVEALADLVSELDRPHSLLLVGHEPDFSTIIGELIGGEVEMKKAAIALVRCESIKAGAGTLAALVPSKLRG